MVPFRTDKFPHRLHRHQMAVGITLGLDSRFLAPPINDDQINTAVIAANTDFMDGISKIAEIQSQ